MQGKQLKLIFNKMIYRNEMTKMHADEITTQ